MPREFPNVNREFLHHYRDEAALEHEQKQPFCASNTFNSIAQNDIVFTCIFIDTFKSAKRSSISYFMIVTKQHLTQNLNNKASRIFLAQNNSFKKRKFEHKTVSAMCH